MTLCFSFSRGLHTAQSNLIRLTVKIAIGAFKMTFVRVRLKKNDAPRSQKKALMLKASSLQNLHGVSNTIQAL